MNVANLQRFLQIVSCLGCASLLANVLLVSLLSICYVGSWSHSSEAFVQANEQDYSREPSLYVGQHLDGRMLSSGDNGSFQSSTASHSSADHSGSHSHSQDALLFFFNAIIFGVILLQMTTWPKLHHMQQTVALFVLGMLYSLVQEGLKFNEHMGVLGHSYDMWMHIDPHLMLFTMLPALLAGDAMALDTNVVKRVAGQCMYLAGPGVVINCLIAASFFKVYLGSYDWPWELCLSTGAILAATDPVAVVSLLKQLGAAPALTILIQGESLLNDGTAIVCFVLAYEMLRGESYGFGEVVIFIVRKAICACGLGWVIGWVFVVWISAASNRFEHHSSMIQVCLTICCAYWSFIIAEGVLDMNGVLCTVSASLVLADNMWGSIVDKQGLLHVWHVVEFLGNTVIFFLAGALTGNCMVHIPWQDYLHLFMIYIVLTIIRGFVIIGSIPVLRRLGKAEVLLSEALVMTWGGLRGAVGLALAIQVNIEKADGKISDINSQRVLFYTGGVAFLTLVVNAVTCPALLKVLGLVQTDDVKRSLLMKVCTQMVRRVEIDNLKPPVRNALQEMMEKINSSMLEAYDIQAREISPSSYPSEDVSSEGFASEGFRSEAESGAKHMGLEAKGDSESSGSGDLMKSELTTQSQGPRGFRQKILARFMVRTKTMTEGDRILENLSDVLQRIGSIPAPIFGLLNVPEPSELALPQPMKAMVTKRRPQPQVMELINATLLSLVQSEYWAMVERGEFIEGSSHPEILLNSVAWAIQSKEARLGDFDFLFKELGLVHRVKPIAVEEKWRENGLSGPNRGISIRKSCNQAIELSAIIADGHVAGAGLPLLQRIITSTWFNVAITVTIILNVVNVFIEESDMKNKSDDEYKFWLTIEICFNSIFLAEFLLKLAALGLDYFSDGWNIFDLVLVISGIFGIVVELALKNDDADVSSEARVFRVNRLFRALRLMRVFRLVQLLEVLRARWMGLEVSLRLAKNMRAITILSCFARAHCKAEQSIEKFYGKALHFRGSELARCIVDSRIAACNAICVAAFEMGKMEMLVLERLAALRESGHITEDLTHFILDAGKMGVMNADDAKHLLEPLREQQHEWFTEEKHHMAGIFDRTKTAGFVGYSSFSPSHKSDNPKFFGRRGSLREAMKNIQNPFSTRRASVQSVVSEVTRRSSFSSSISDGDDERKATPEKVDSHPLNAPTNENDEEASADIAVSSA